MQRKKGIVVLIIAVVLLGVASLWWFRSKGGPVPLFQTVPVRRGDIEATISATGSVEPAVVVDVGAQVSGIIRSFGKGKDGKMIDYHSPVEAGTVLANIDDSLYSAAVKSSKAQMQQAMASKVSADANVLQMKAQLFLAQLNWDRAQKLGPSDALAKSTYDQYQATYEAAKANLAASESAVEQAKAAVALAKANLDTAQMNLGYCTIKSPVKGVIVDRRVNIGQTVVSTTSATSLFLIATDLKRIKVWLSVNENAVGSIASGQPVTFTVDAYPNRVFHGEVGKVRFNATITQNVVMYTVEVNAENDDGALLPYLTANAKFMIGHRSGVLLVPNAALRWSPLPNQIAPGASGKSRGHAGPSAPDMEAEAHGDGRAAQVRGTLWVKQGKFVRPVHVKIGVTDGFATEVEGRDLAEDLQVVVGETMAESNAGPGA